MENTNLENKPLVLVVDDQPVNRQLLSIILEKLNYPAIFAEDGQEALEKAESADVAIILMDIQMPKIDGCQAAEILRKKGFSRPIVAVTSSDLPAEKEQYFEAGMDDIMVKPFKRADVERILAKWGDSKYHEPYIKAEEPIESLKSGCAFDAKKMMETFLNDKEVVLPLLVRFIERTEGQIKDLPNLEKAGDWEGARRDAHMIKGAALTLGGTELGDAASRLEQVYLKNQTDGIEAAYQPLCKAFDVFRKEAEAYLRENK